MTMSRSATILYAMLFVTSLVIRDVALGFIFNPVTTFVFAEIHNEKETSEKGGKEGGKEIDEYRFPALHLHTRDLILSASGIPASYTPYYPSVITEVQGRPPEFV